MRRAQEKLDAALKEIEETEKQKRLGPGGLDPVEVYESLPPVSTMKLRPRIPKLSRRHSIFIIINFIE